MKKTWIFLGLLLASTVTFAAKINGPLIGASLEKLASQPVDVPVGRIYYDTGLGLAMLCDGATCNSLGGGGGGGVASVAFTEASTSPIFTITGSPVTSAGTLTETLKTQVKNTGLFGPVSGANAQPTFRALVGADLPNPSSSSLGGVQSAAAVTNQWINSISTSGVPALSQPAFTDISGTATVAQGGTGQTSYTNGQLLIGNTATGGLTKATITAGANVTVTNGNGSITIAATGGGGGGVSSVDMSVPSFLSISGNPITTSGTLAVSYSGTALPIANGGTGQTTAATAINALLPSQTGNSGKFLTTNGTIASWGSPAGAGTVTSVDFSDASSTPIFAITGNPVTSSGTLTETLVTQSANTIFSGPTTGAAAQPAFRALVGADLPNPSSSTKGGVQSAAAVSNQWINSISTSGVPALSQPAFSNISGTVAASQLPNPSASTLGGVQSAAPVSNQWINSISTSGVPALSQPAFSNLSGTATVAQGGTGQTTYTDGQLLIGNTSGNTLTKATLTAGTGVTITNGNGSITIAASGGGGGSGLTRFTLENEVIPYTDIGGPHYQTATQSLTAVNISMLNSGSAGSTVIQVNQYRSGALQGSATASLSASSGNPAGTAASLSGTLSLASGDVLTVDVVSVAAGTPSGLSVEF